MTALAPSLSINAIEESNYRHLIQDIAWFGLAFTATSRFLSVFALRLGANEAVLAWITSLPALFILLSAAFTPMWRARKRDSVHALMLPTFIQRLVFLLPALAPILPPAWRVPWLLLSAMIPGLGQGIASVIFLTCVQESVSQNRMTELFSRRSLFFNVTLAASALIYGAWLEFAPFPFNYQLMYVFAFGFALTSQWHCSRLKPVFAAPQPVAPMTSASPWRSLDFRITMIILVVTFASVNVTNALIPARLVNEMNANEGYMALYSLTELLSGAFISLFAPRIIARIGNYRMIALSMAAMGIAGALLGVSGNLAIGLISGGIAGASWMLVAMVGVVALYTAATPLQEATRYSVVYQQVFGITTFLAPFAGTILIDLDFSLSEIMLIGAGLRLAAGAVVGAIWWWRSHKLSTDPLRA